jgi:hypothetical protein
MSHQANDQRERELETRQIELFMQIYRQRYSPEFVRSWIRFGQLGWPLKPATFLPDGKYGPLTTDIDARASVMILGAYYEDIGLLLEQGLVDVDLLYNLLYTGLRDYWGRMSPTIQVWRSRGMPIWYNVERLYDLLTEKHQQLQPTAVQ